MLGAVLAIAGFALWLVLMPADGIHAGRGASAPAPGRGEGAVRPADAVPDMVPRPVAVAVSEPEPVAVFTPPAAAAVEQASKASGQTTALRASAPASSPPPAPATDVPHEDVTPASIKLDAHVSLPLPREAKAAASISKQLAKPTPEEEAEDRYRKALNLVNKGRDIQARPLLEEALRLAPGHVAARQVFATLLNENGLNREAEAVLREGLLVNSDNAWFALSLARLQAARGDLDEAAASLRSGLDGRGVTAEYHATYATILSRLKRPVEAGSQYEQALALQPGQGPWWIGLGLALSAQGKLPEARAAYGRALQAGNLSETLEDFVRAKLSE
ncbi:MAG: tetratricopeptide repeat protein [Thiobacillus sp.]|nr:tetratricopeptide repeat protein [Thiobacillus sp.]